MPLTLVRASSPRWGNGAHSFLIIDCEWEQMPQLGLMGFAAAPTDPEPHGRQVFERALDGEFGVIREYEPPPPLPSPLS